MPFELPRLKLLAETKVSAQEQVVEETDAQVAKKAAEVKTRVLKALRTMGFKADESGSTPGTMKTWMSMKGKKYNWWHDPKPGSVWGAEFDKEGAKKFVQDLSELIHEPVQMNVHGRIIANDFSFFISLQGGRTLCVSVPRNNKAGEKYKQGYDS